MVSKEVSFLNGFSIFICVTMWFLYFLVVNKQHGYITPETYRLQVLSSRCGLCLPVYGLIVLISLVYPESFFALEVVVSVFEGYSFYCFFAFVVTNLGGPESAVKIMKDNGKPLCVPTYCCNCCCPEDRTDVYNKTLWNEWHFVFSRTIIVLIATIFKGTGTKTGKQLFVILSVIAFFVLVNGVMSVVNFYENVMNDCANLKGIMKFLIIKVSVGLLVFQTIVTEGVIEFNKVSLHTTDEFDKDDRALRLTLFVSMCEYFILGLCMYFAFGAQMEPSQHLKLKNTTGIEVKKTVLEFWLDILKFHDVFNTLNIPVRGSVHQNLLDSDNRV
jgi:hypothetical protein